MPPPYIHLSRYFGILSSHSKWRSKIILKPHVKKGFVALPGGGTTRMTWARLLARVFKEDIIRCKTCGVKLYPENFEIVTDPLLVGAILQALGLAAVPPPRQRGPPRLPLEDSDVDQRQPYLD